jgi:TatD DNase family protein
MRLIDTHAHIHDDAFGDDGAAAVARAAAAGVERIVTLGVTRADSETAVAFAARHLAVVAAVGVHPHDAKDASEADLDALEALARDERVVAVGEIGLDFYRNLSPRDVQVRVFSRQLETASRVSKPIAVHARDAHDVIMPLLEDWSRRMDRRLPDGRSLGVMHYFSADADAARRYVELGFVISIHTSATHPKSAVLQEVAREIPLEHLVIETDSPYGAPQAYRGKRNEPAYVAEAARMIGELKGVPIETVATATTDNAARLFGLAVHAGGS